MDKLTTFKLLLGLQFGNLVFSSAVVLMSVFRQKKMPSPLSAFLAYSVATVLFVALLGSEAVEVSSQWLGAFAESSSWSMHRFSFHAVNGLALTLVAVLGCFFGLAERENIHDPDFEFSSWKILIHCSLFSLVCLGQSSTGALIPLMASLLLIFFENRNQSSFAEQLSTYLCSISILVMGALMSFHLDLANLWILGTVSIFVVFISSLIVEARSVSVVLSQGLWVLSLGFWTIRKDLTGGEEVPLWVFWFSCFLGILLLFRVFYARNSQESIGARIGAVVLFGCTWRLFGGEFESVALWMLSLTLSSLVHLLITRQKSEVIGLAETDPKPMQSIWFYFGCFLILVLQFGMPGSASFQIFTQHLEGGFQNGGLIDYGKIVSWIVVGSLLVSGDGVDFYRKRIQMRTTGMNIFSSWILLPLVFLFVLAGNFFGIQGQDFFESTYRALQRNANQVFTIELGLWLLAQLVLIVILCWIRSAFDGHLKKETGFSGWMKSSWLSAGFRWLDSGFSFQLMRLKKRSFSGRIFNFGNLGLVDRTLWLLGSYLRKVTEVIEGGGRRIESSLSVSIPQAIQISLRSRVSSEIIWAFGIVLVLILKYGMRLIDG